MLPAACCREFQLPARQENSMGQISVGATFSSSDDSEEALLARADRFMYESKSAGENRVTADA